MSNDAPGIKIKTVEEAMAYLEQQQIDPATATLEELETPDELERRGLAAKAEEEKEPESNVVVDDGFSLTNASVNTETDHFSLPVEKRPTHLIDRHPDYEYSIDNQLMMFRRALELCQAEIEVNARRVNHLEIQIDLYPLVTADVDLVEMRALMWKLVQLRTEEDNIMRNIEVREKALQKRDNPKKGWFSRLIGL